MSPLDDELRTLLGQRAAGLAPSPDPLAGIETRARRIRRNRVAASVAGTALAVATLAAVVPAVLPEKVAKGGSSQFADPTPTPSASTTSNASIPPSGYDPADPWPYRGNPALIAPNELRSLEAEWAAANHPESTITPLVGLVNEVNKQTEIAFASTAKGVNTFAVATSSDSGWEFLYEAPFVAGTTALMAAIRGDERPRLLIVASPRTIGDISYAADGTSFASRQGPFPGVAFVPLEGDTSADVVRVLDGDGDLDKPLYLGDAPDYAPVKRPSNAVDWKTSGYAAPSLDFVEKAVTGFARGMGFKRADVDYQVLFAGDDDAGNTYVFGQAWGLGQQAQGFGLTRNAKGEETPFLGAVTPDDPVVLAFTIPAGTGQSTETLAVITAPSVKTVEYGAAASEYRTAGASQDFENVNLVERDPMPEGDKLRLLDGAGKTLFEDEVFTLLCGIKGCG